MKAFAGRYFHLVVLFLDILQNESGIFTCFVFRLFWVWKDSDIRVLTSLEMGSSSCVFHAHPSVVRKREGGVSSGTHARTTRGILQLSHCVKWVASIGRTIAYRRRNIKGVSASCWSRNVENLRTRKVNAQLKNQQRPNLNHRFRARVRFRKSFRQSTNVKLPKANDQLNECSLEYYS